jgi:hypothetical protein
LGTQITQAMMPYTITVPGHYYLCESVTASTIFNGTITINANDVYLNLNGFTVTNTSGAAIASSGIRSFSNHLIENGSIVARITDEGYAAIAIALVTNATLKNLDITVNNVSASIAANGINAFNMANLVIEDCIITGINTQLGYGVEIAGITGGRLENVTAYNIGTSGSSSGGFLIETITAGSVFELINCSAVNAGIGFSISGGGSGITVLRNCVAIDGSRGFFIGANLTFLENCVSSYNAGNAFDIEFGQGIILRNCIAQSNGGSGFWYTGDTGVITEECISKGNEQAGFLINSLEGTNKNCVLDKCVALNNPGGEGFYENMNINTRVLRSVASGNLRGYYAFSPTGAFLVDSRTQHAATTKNPAYNLNTIVNTLAGTTEIIIS